MKKIISFIALIVLMSYFSYSQQSKGVYTGWWLVTVDKDGKKVGYVAYYQLQSKFASHSGDIRTASDGAAEYIDINTELATLAEVSE